MGFFELNKSNIETEAQGHWRDYFLTGEVKPEAPDYIKKASRIIELANLSEDEKAMTTLLERAQADYDASISDAYHDGRDEGRVEGMDYKAREMAKKMLKKDYEPEEIVDVTDLTLDVIKTLKP